MRRHLIALDGKPEADYAFEWYLDNVMRPDDQVVICHCSLFELHIGMPGVGVNIEAVGKQVKDAMEKSEAVTEKAAEMLRRKGVKGYSRVKSGMKPEEAILQVIDEEEVSHVFMGTRDLKTIKRAFVGSVSTYVVQHAKVPVTIIKTPH